MGEDVCATIQRSRKCGGKFCLVGWTGSGGRVRGWCSRVSFSLFSTSPESDIGSSVMTSSPGGVGGACGLREVGSGVAGKTGLGVMGVVGLTGVCRLVVEGSAEKAV